MEVGLVFNIQRYSLQDGPGIRTTVFLKGCPLCCPWCHNPEGVSPEREILVLEGRCIVCGECRKACPAGATIAGEGSLPARSDSCTLCERCVEACPTGARQVVGREMTVREVFGAVLEDRIFYDSSGGGVTISGGEPLLQPRFLRSLLETCRERGVHTAVDTCGFACTETLLEIATLTDLFLYDVKIIDAEKHREHIGVSSAPILENLRILGERHGNIWLRVPLIPGVNDSAENLDAVGRVAASVRGMRQVNVLPYHGVGARKFRRLGRSYSMEGVEAPSEDAVEAAVERLRAWGLAVRAGG